MVIKMSRRDQECMLTYRWHRVRVLKRRKSSTWVWNSDEEIASFQTSSVDIRNVINGMPMKRGQERTPSRVRD